jgi:hypothetical protein
MQDAHMRLKNVVQRIWIRELAARLFIPVPWRTLIGGNTGASLF